MEEKRKPKITIIPATKPGYTPIELPKTNLKWEDITYDSMMDLYLRGCHGDDMMAAVFGVTTEEVKCKRKELDITTADIRDARRMHILSETMENFKVTKPIADK